MEDKQEHNHMHAFGAAVFMIVLVGLIALSYVWQTNNQQQTNQSTDTTLAASAVSVLPADPNAPLYQPEEPGQLLEGDSLNGYETDYVGYVNQDYGVSFSFLRALELVNTADSTTGLRVEVQSDDYTAANDGSREAGALITLTARRDENPQQYITGLVNGSDPSAADAEEVETSETESGYEVVQFQVVEGEGTRFVTAIASDEIRYDLSFFSGESDPKEDSFYPEYTYILDSLFIQ